MARKHTVMRMPRGSHAVVFFIRASEKNHLPGPRPFRIASKNILLITILCVSDAQKKKPTFSAPIQTATVAELTVGGRAGHRAAGPFTRGSGGMLPRCHAASITRRKRSFARYGCPPSCWIWGRRVPQCRLLRPSVCQTSRRGVRKAFCWSACGFNTPFCACKTCSRALVSCLHWR